MKLESNIWKFGLFTFIDRLRLVWMIFTLYVLWLGFDFTNIGIHNLIFAAVIVLFELPTGVLSDIIGRKKALALSSFFLGAGWLIFAVMNAPWEYYISALIGGIGAAFLSGSDSAILYDTLKDLNRESEYKKVRGRINGIAQISSIIGVILGPMLYIINPRLAFYVTAVLYLITTIIALTMKEPVNTQKLTFKKHYEHMKESIVFALTHKKIVWLVFFSFTVYLVLDLFYDYWQQPLLVGLGFEVKYFSWLFAFMLLFRGFISYFTHIIEDYLKENLSIIVIFLVNIAALLLISVPNFDYLIVGFILLYGIMGFEIVVIEDYINGHISKKNRGAVLSVNSLIVYVLNLLPYFLVGLLMDTFGINIIIFYYAIIFSGMSFILYLAYSRLYHGSSH